LLALLAKDSFESDCERLFGWWRHVICSGNQKVDIRVVRALKFIRRGCRSRELSLGRTAHAARVSPSYLDRLLQTETGMTFTQHRRVSRIEVARVFLAGTDLLEKQIAALVGYMDNRGVPNDRALRRDFHRICGIAPNEYRRGLWYIPESAKKEPVPLHRQGSSSYVQSRRHQQ
jgi:AraC-like DNA-binding protein